MLKQFIRIIIKVKSKKTEWSTNHFQQLRLCCLYNEVVASIKELRILRDIKSK